MTADRRIELLKAQRKRLEIRLNGATDSESRNNLRAIIRAVESDIRRLSAGGVRRW